MLLEFQLAGVIPSNEPLEKRKMRSLPACLPACLTLIVALLHARPVTAQGVPVGLVQRFVNPENQSGTVDGLTWLSGFLTLTDALDPAVNTILAGANPGSVEIRVLGGKHIPGPSITFPSASADPRHATFYLPEAVAALRGGWDGTELPGAPPSGALTVLSGDRGLAGDPSDNCYHVLVPFGPHVGNGQWITDLTIEAGQADGNYSFDTYGGGVLLFGASALMWDVRIKECYAHFGGGMAVLDLAGTHSSLKVTRGEFIRNNAKEDGGAAYLGVSGPMEVVNCRVVGNNATFNGGGLMLAV